MKPSSRLGPQQDESRDLACWPCVRKGGGRGSFRPPEPCADTRRADPLPRRLEKHRVFPTLATSRRGDLLLRCLVGLAPFPVPRPYDRGSTASSGKRAALVAADRPRGIGTGEDWCSVRRPLVVTFPAQATRLIRDRPSSPEPGSFHWARGLQGWGGSGGEGMGGALLQHQQLPTPPVFISHGVETLGTTASFPEELGDYVALGGGGVGSLPVSLGLARGLRPRRGILGLPRTKAGAGDRPRPNLTDGIPPFPGFLSPLLPPAPSGRAI